MEWPRPVLLFNMPSYVGLEQQGFYEPFRLLGQGLAAMRDRAQEKQLRERALKGQEDRDVQAAKTAELQRGLLQKQTERLTPKDFKAPEGMREKQVTVDELGNPTRVFDLAPKPAVTPPGMRPARTTVDEQGQQSTVFEPEIPPMVTPPGMRPKGVTVGPDGKATTSFGPDILGGSLKPVIGPDGRPVPNMGVDEAGTLHNIPRPDRLTDGDKALSINLAEAKKGLQTLKNVILDYGNYEQAWGALGSDAKGVHSGRTSNEASAALSQLPYSLAIQYSKIVDPSTAAREGEVAAASKYMIPMGKLTPNAKTLASIDDMLTQIESREAAANTIREQSGLAPISLAPSGVKPPTGGPLTPESIKAAFKAGQMTREQAAQALRGFGFK